MHRLRRSALVFWVSAGALAIATGIVVAGFVGDAQARAARFGGLRTVLVALRPVEAGAVVRAGDVGPRAMPAAFVPVGPLARSPVGRTVVVPLAAGEVLLAAKVAPAGLHGVAALLRDGERALAVPVGAGTPPLEAGDVVDVLATDPGDGATEVVARRARVVDLDDRAVTVAIRVDDAPSVASALAAATVTLALAAR